MCRPIPTRSEIDGNRIWTYLDSPQTCSGQWHKIFIIVCSSSNSNCYKSWRHISEVITFSEYTWMMRSVVRISPQPCLGLNNHVHPFHVLNKKFCLNNYWYHAARFEPGAVWALPPWPPLFSATGVKQNFDAQVQVEKKSHECKSLMTCRFTKIWGIPKVRQEHDHKNHEWVRYVALLWACSILHTTTGHWIGLGIVSSHKQLWITKVAVPIFTIGGHKKHKMSKWWIYLTLNTNSEHQEWYLYFWA